LRGIEEGGGGIAAGAADGERGSREGGGAAVEEDGVVDAAFDGAVVEENGIAERAETLEGVVVVDDEGLVGEVAGGHDEYGGMSLEG
jgi:hypothetical protein